MSPIELKWSIITPMYCFAALATAGDARRAATSSAADISSTRSLAALLSRIGVSCWIPTRARLPYSGTCKIAGAEQLRVRGRLIGGEAVAVLAVESFIFAGAAIAEAHNCDA
jgi:hypothetical protein